MKITVSFEDRGDDDPESYFSYVVINSDRFSHLPTDDVWTEIIKQLMQVSFMGKISMTAKLIEDIVEYGEEDDLIKLIDQDYRNALSKSLQCFLSENNNG